MEIYSTYKISLSQGYESTGQAPLVCAVIRSSMLPPSGQNYYSTRLYWSLGNPKMWEADTSNQISAASSLRTDILLNNTQNAKLSKCLNYFQGYVAVESYFRKP